MVYIPPFAMRRTGHPGICGDSSEIQGFFASLRMTVFDIGGGCWLGWVIAGLGTALGLGVLVTCIVYGDRDWCGGLRHNRKRGLSGFDVEGTGYSVVRS